MLIENSCLHHSRHLFDLQRTTLTCPAKSANSKRSSQVSLTHNPCTRISEQKRQPVAFRPKNMSDGCLDITWFGTLESNFKQLARILVFNPFPDAVGVGVGAGKSSSKQAQRRHICKDRELRTKFPSFTDTQPLFSNT